MHTLIESEEKPELTLPKTTSFAFGKKVYLIGQDENATKYWLEEPKWDCGWYWGFGYIETYQDNREPSKARDIDSHQHWDGFVGQLYTWSFDYNAYIKGEYIHHINQNKLFKFTTLTEKESWELSDLMKSFYDLKTAAEFFRFGNSHLTTTAISKNLVNKRLEKNINEKVLPQIFKRIDEILSPKDKVTK